MLVVVQFRKNPKSSVHEIRILVEKINEWGLDFSKIALLNFANLTLDFFDFLPILKKAKAVVTGGSGDYGFYDLEKGGEKAKEFKEILARTNKLFKFLLQEKIPSLHICFGHQLLGNFLGGKVKTGKEFEEVGAAKIRLTEQGKKDPLFKNVPKEFFASEGHHSAVVDLPKDIPILAFSDKGIIQAFRFKNFWGVQFHPEMTYEENKERYRMSIGYEAEKYLPASQLQPYISKEIILNFLEIVF